MSIFQNVSHFLLHDSLHYYPFQRKIKGPSDFPSASRFPLVNMLIYLYYTLLWLYRWPQKTAVNAFFPPIHLTLHTTKTKKWKKLHCISETFSFLQKILIKRHQRNAQFYKHLWPCTLKRLKQNLCIWYQDYMQNMSNYIQPLFCKSIWRLNQCLLSRGTFKWIIASFCVNRRVVYCESYILNTRGFLANIFLLVLTAQIFTFQKIKQIISQLLWEHI